MTLSVAPFRPGARATFIEVASWAWKRSFALRLPALTLSEPSVGGVASYLSAKLAAVWLPALSRQEPLTEAFGLSGPAYVACVQDAICEVASVPLKPTASAWLYHPLASAGRPARAATVGGVASRRIGTVTVMSVPSSHQA